MSKEIHVPDWSGGQISLPEEGFVPPEYSFTFFPNPTEAKKLKKITPEDLAKTIWEQTELTSRFLHEMITIGRVKVAQETVRLLGEDAIDFVNYDWRTALWSMTHDFVPEDEVQKVITAFHELGFSDLIDTRVNLRIVNTQRLREVEQQKPTREELLAYVRKHNQGQLNQGYLKYTDDLRIIDPRRKLCYVGLGDTKDYNWVDISPNHEFRQTAHYTAPDQETRMALLLVY